MYTITIYKDAINFQTTAETLSEAIQTAIDLWRQHQCAVIVEEKGVDNGYIER